MRAEGQGSSAAHSRGPGVRAWWASGGSGGLGATQKAPGSGLTSDGSPVAFGFRLWRGVGTLVAEDCPGWTVQNSRGARSRPRGSRDPGLCSFLRLDRRVWAGRGSSRDVRATVFVHVGVPRPLPPSLSWLPVRSASTAGVAPCAGQRPAGERPAAGSTAGPGTGRAGGPGRPALPGAQSPRLPSAWAVTRESPAAQGRALCLAGGFAAGEGGRGNGTRGFPRRRERRPCRWREVRGRRPGRQPPRA